MVSTVRVSVSPPVLSWAVQRTGLSSEELEKKFPQLLKWQSGDAQPTLKQAKELARAAHIPFGRLLLEQPSGDEVGVSDFRTLRNAEVVDASPNLQDTIFANQNRLGWYSEFAAEEGIEPPSLFGSIPEGTSARAAAQSVRCELGLKESSPLPGGDKVRELAALMEGNGILVARNSIVGNSTRRPLNVEEFRGFTIEDDGFVLVFVNTRDAKSAQLFSLAHELGHVVRGRPGISDHSDHEGVERWCNQFAAEFLAPVEAVVAMHREDDLVASVNRLSTRFGMSREAMLWRLVELGIVRRDEAEKLVGLVRSAPAKSSEDESGAPPPHVLVRSRVGGLFYDTVTNAAANGQIPELEAARYLGAKTHESFTKLVSARHREVV